MGQQFWRIAVLNFITLIVMTFFVEFPRHLMSKYCCRPKNAVPKKETCDRTVEIHRLSSVVHGGFYDLRGAENGNNNDNNNNGNNGDATNGVRLNAAAPNNNATTSSNAIPTGGTLERDAAAAGEVQQNKFCDMIGNVQFVLERNVLDLVYIQVGSDLFSPYNFYFCRRRRICDETGKHRMLTPLLFTTFLMQ